jgi:hypothetical protein
MAEEKDKPAEPAKEADAERAAWAAFMQALKNDPHFRVVRGTGEGFIIGPAPPKKLEGDGG